MGEVISDAAEDVLPARGRFLHTSRYIAITFATVIVVGTALLLLPVSSQQSGSTSFMTAFFTATSAACVTGLTVVDTGSHWSGFGQWVILGLIQIGGLGIMTLSSLVILSLSRRLGMRQKMAAASAAGSVAPGELRGLLIGILDRARLVRARRDPPPRERDHWSTPR